MGKQLSTHDLRLTVAFPAGDSLHRGGLSSKAALFAGCHSLRYKTLGAEQHAAGITAQSAKPDTQQAAASGVRKGDSPAAPLLCHREQGDETHRTEGEPAV
ncbi:hypothetical protein H920_15356 [Fukomys damarensis]|uniref:Uncharacterized protein n=1 Tax=Fukomys damarensis TaxID=885580 RepID=A0A091DKA3_FUKDA|nr:hypothetical protein H920_15356 [Fukomys damarensis]